MADCGNTAIRMIFSKVLYQKSMEKKTLNKILFVFCEGKQIEAVCEKMNLQSNHSTKYRALRENADPVDCIFYTQKDYETNPAVQKTIQILSGDSGCLVVTDSEIFYQEIAGKNPVVAYVSEKDKLFPKAEYLIEDFGADSMEYLFEAYCRMNRIPLVIGENGRIMIREMIPEDAAALHGLYAKEEELYYIESLNAFGQTPEETEEYIRSQYLRRYAIWGYGMWNILAKDTGEIIGRVGFQDTEEENTVELGYLVKKKWRRQNIALEACELSMEYMKKNYPKLRIRLEINDNNLPAIALARRIKQRFSDMEIVYKKCL